ncbi:hypothetical protein NUU61_006012 [Penicillium alfredii]|uniref:Uncharacterized protein n=1 Tax=Penicillium alfredii TaxID=1506179 RepID=A0A9W9K3U9_9EURO|nr:uncharacterized protein NUU61_006012 [Penicillium alfredii]KAJ5091142.1 hypothetical protein NUU61_006012 [Penicillium alfredii]
MEKSDVIFEPASATYQVDYITDVKLESKLGSDIPLYDMYFEMHGEKENRKLERKWGTQFNSEKEDYWLFCVHCHDAECEFIIGGKTFVVTTSAPSLRNFSDEEVYKIDYGMPHPYPYYVEFVANLRKTWDRYVAIRCPKMSNPAITVKATGNYGALQWVGLFVKAAVDQKNQFITVKTSNRLLPQYAERIKDYSWFSWDGPVDVTDRTITLFPKQLFGTKGNSQDLYDEYVTSNPQNTVGEKHFAIARNYRKPAFPYQGSQPGSSDEVAIGSQGLNHGFKDRITKAQCLKYVWSVDQRTEFAIWRDPRVPPPSGGLAGPTAACLFAIDYATGVEIKQQDVHGLESLLVIFGTIAEVVGYAMTGNIAKGFMALLEMPDKAKEISTKASIHGFVKAVLELAETTENELSKKAKEVNKKSTKEIADTKDPPASDFGSN